MAAASRKLFVGSLPFGIQDATLRSEFSRFGQVEDIFIKPNCDPARQWAFVTMATPEQARSAKDQTDRILMFVGAERPCEVMVAKNQGMFGQSNEPGAPVHASGHHAAGGVHAGGLHSGLLEPQPQYSGVAPTKIFVGSLPDGIQEASLRFEYAKYGSVTDIFVKPGCEPGRQWAFVSFQSPQEAEYAQQMTNGILQFPGQLRGCEVTMARNQGMFGKEPIAAGPPRQEVHVPSVTENMMAPKKVFVGSLPAGITEAQLQAEFAKYGQIVDMHINSKPADSGRQWAFITFASADQAHLAKVSTDRVLMFPGAVMACEVTLARHQGMFGQESIVQDHPVNVHHAPAVVAPLAAPAAVAQPRKVFVGSLPETVNDAILRSEFSRYGQVIDVFVSDKPCEPGRNWAFVTFANMEQAQFAKDSTDRVLIMPGADRACEVMLAKNQGKFGQESIAGPAAAPPVQQVLHAIPGPPPGGQPPPPSAPPPAHLTPWRMYKTAAGLPYYHNSQTQVTQWECPPELQVPGQASVYSLPPAQPAVATAGVRYAPY